MSIHARLDRLEQLAVDASGPDIDLSQLSKADWLIVREARRLASAAGLPITLETIRQAKSNVGATP